MSLKPGGNATCLPNSQVLRLFEPLATSLGACHFRFRAQGAVLVKSLGSNQNPRGEGNDPVGPRFCLVTFLNSGYLVGRSVSVSGNWGTVFAGALVEKTLLSEGFLCGFLGPLSALPFFKSPSSRAPLPSPFPGLRPAG